MEYLPVIVMSAITSTVTSRALQPITPMIQEPQINENFLHLTFDHVKRICSHREEICANPNISSVCTMRLVEGTKHYKEFHNACFASLGNMCDHPGKEYHIITSGSCSKYLVQRRTAEAEGNTNNKDDNNTTVSGEDDYDSKNHTDLRNGSDDDDENPVKYDVDTSFDGHPCPYFCPDTYEPYCVNVNRNYGKHLKYFTFINHCHADMYYCKHFQDWGPPPETEYEQIESSPQSWSFCSSYRYIQFARFSEQVSSLGHYGWLAGNQRYSKILNYGDKVALTGPQRYRNI